MGTVHSLTPDDIVKQKTVPMFSFLRFLVKEEEKECELQSMRLPQSFHSFAMTNSNTKDVGIRMLRDGPLTSFEIVDFDTFL